MKRYRPLVEWFYVCVRGECFQQFFFFSKKCGYRSSFFILFRLNCTGIPPRKCKFCDKFVKQTTPIIFLWYRLRERRNRVEATSRSPSVRPTVYATLFATTRRRDQISIFRRPASTGGGGRGRRFSEAYAETVETTGGRTRRVTARSGRRRTAYTYNNTTAIT